MKLIKITSVILMLALVLCSLSAAVFAEENTSEEAVWYKVDMSAWNYNEDADVYWQTGIQYCSVPADAEYENLGIYVPGAYFDAVENGDETYTCTVNSEGESQGYTAETAPVVIPVNTPGYSAMSAPTGYTSEAGEYAAMGFIYVAAGCRGRDSGAPAGVTDLKAAIRFIRANADILPGDFDSVFSFGMSGGGAQSALLGATGDSDLYDAYLEQIGAVMETSDAVKGSMCWCPITNLDVADAAYEWNMGTTRSSLSDEERAISDGLAEAFAEYINELNLTDEDGNILTLEASEEGIYQAGTYYEYVKDIIEESLRNFLTDTSWPYDASSSEAGGMGGMRGGNMKDGMDGFPDGEKSRDLPDGEMPSNMGEMPDGEVPSDFGELPDGDMPGNITDGDLPTDTNEVPAEGKTDITELDGITRDEASADSGISLSGIYETPQDYIDALNSNGEWVTYDSETGEVTITDIASFVNTFKKASKSLGAFDQLDCGQGENELFGYGDSEGKHFDSILAEVLENLGADEAEDYADDLALTDELGTSVITRSNMYNPMYYLCDYYEGAGTSIVAQYFRIRTGIEQSDTSLCTEIDLALALEAAGSKVDFETVWGQGHTEAERIGDSSSNFIEWVNECMAEG